MANERTAERIAGILRRVADNVDSYLPDEWLLDGSTFVVRIPDRNSMPTVELDAEMLVLDDASTVNESMQNASLPSCSTRKVSTK